MQHQHGGSDAAAACSSLQVYPHIRGGINLLYAFIYQFLVDHHLTNFPTLDTCIEPLMYGTGRNCALDYCFYLPEDLSKGMIKFVKS